MARRRSIRTTCVVSGLALSLWMPVFAAAHGSVELAQYDLGLTGPRTVASNTWVGFTGRLSVEGIVGIPEQRIYVAANDLLFGATTEPDGWFEVAVVFPSTGTYRVEARTVGDGVRSNALVISVVDAIELPRMTVSVTGARAHRVPGSVEVVIGLVGRADVPAGSVVTGMVTVGAGTGCWDPGFCLDYEYEQTLPFRAVVDANRRYWIWVGPFGFTADIVAIVPSCKSLGASAVSSSADVSATGGAVFQPCA